MSCQASDLVDYSLNINTNHNESRLDISTEKQTNIDLHLATTILFYKTLPLTTSWQGLNTSLRMTLHILWAHGARCLFVAQGFLGTTASGHDDSTFQLSPKSLAKVSGNICGVMKSSFLSSLKFPHKPQVCPDKEHLVCFYDICRDSRALIG